MSTLTSGNFHTQLCKFPHPCVETSTLMGGSFHSLGWQCGGHFHHISTPGVEMWWTFPPHFHPSFQFTVRVFRQNRNTEYNCLLFSVLFFSKSTLYVQHTPSVFAVIFKVLFQIHTYIYVYTATYIHKCLYRHTYINTYIHI